MTMVVSTGVFFNIVSKCGMCALLFFVCSFFASANAADATASAERESRISILRGAEKIAVFTVETVSDQQKLEKGLSGRPSIPDDFGMLFILDSASAQFFWMNGMAFSLDILFFDKDNTLTAIMSNLSHCVECIKHRAPAHTAYALEINGGLANILGIKEGDRIVFKDK
jgi:uncharacterized membrane protein (UPF0127 family)